MKITKYMGIALAIASFTACSSDDDSTSTWQNDPNAVKINANVSNPLITKSNPLSSATTEQGAFNEGDKISVSAGTQSAVTYTLSGTSWTPESTSFLKWESTNMNINAYYPLGTGISTQAFTLPTDQSSPEKIVKSDYMTFSGIKTKSSTSNDLELEMNRKTSRIIVNIEKFGEQFASVPTIKDVKIYSAAEAYNNGEIVTSTTEISPYAQNLNEGAAQIGTTYTALVIPPSSSFDASSETFIQMSVNDVTLKVKGIPALEAGKSYKYNLTIGKTSITFGNITVSDWIEGTIQGSETEEITTVETYDLTDFCRWDAYLDVTKSTEGSAWIPTSSWNNPGSDVASQLCWNCPSAYQWVAHVTAGTYWDAGLANGKINIQSYTVNSGEIHHAGLWLLKQEYVGGSSPYKTVDAVPTNGRPAPDVIDKYFFLPAAGGFIGGESEYIGTDGFYWSKSCYSDAYNSHAYYLYFNKDAVKVMTHIRSNGMMYVPLQ